MMTYTKQILQHYFLKQNLAGFKTKLAEDTMIITVILRYKDKFTILSSQESCYRYKLYLCLNIHTHKHIHTNTVSLSFPSFFRQFFLSPWTPACQAPLSFTVSRRLLKFMFIESVLLCNHLILCCPLLFLPSIYYTRSTKQIRVLIHCVRIGWNANRAQIDLSYPRNIDCW